MSLTPGARLGPYEVLSAIGAGGMGEVYKARDTRLDRVVALKVLPTALAGDPEFRERFEREARNISQLTHPNICTLYDVGREHDVEFLVMELLEGETLAARLANGPLPPAEALIIGTEVASALDKAHRHSIVHRDLKPGNVMLTKTGAKLLDFGLAKAAVAATPISTATATPTRTASIGEMRGPLTAQGTILGTFQYMAPEQIEGEEADARTDIFAFGALLFEMVTGRRAFSGKSQASLFGAILKDEPPAVSSIQPLVPPALDRVIKTCLAKDPNDRFQTSHDLLLQLRWIQEGGSSAGVPAPIVAHRRRRERVIWIALGVVTALWIATLIPAARLYFRTEPDPPRIQFAIPLPDTGLVRVAQLSVSPDGRWVTFVAAGQTDGSPMLWLRALSGLNAQILTGTENASNPFWSPDSRYIGFVSGTTLKKIAVAGGPPQNICEVQGYLGGAWNRDDVIVVAKGGIVTTSLLGRVSAAGGPLTDLAPGGPDTFIVKRWPIFLPDGRHVLFQGVVPDVNKRGLWVESIEGGPPQFLLPAESMALYAPPGLLLYHREGTLLAQAFDAARLRLTGDPVRVADNVAFNAQTLRAAFGVSDTGVLAFRTGGGGEGFSDLTWIDRTGKALATIGEPQPYYQVRLSPDQKRIVFALRDSRVGRYTLWTIELGNGISSQLTFEDAPVNDPAWSPDSSRVMFEMTSKGKLDLFEQVVGSRGAKPVFESDDRVKWLDDWSADGQFVLFHTPPPGSKLVAVPLTGDRKPMVLTDDKGNLDSAHFSPDGKWVAYQSSATGIFEVWVAAFPAFDKRRQLSSRGGGQPFWRSDGKELFYLTPDGKLMSVPVSVDPSGALDARAPALLFQSPIPRPTLMIDQYSVARDGQRFLFIAPQRERAVAPDPITVIVNWRSSAGQ